jgi:hypothetical protein
MRVFPEVGALSGDAGGCDRALVWGLFAAVAPLFGVQTVEGKATPPTEGEPRPEPCRFRIEWSYEKVPGR